MVTVAELQSQIDALEIQSQRASSPATAIEGLGVTRQEIQAVQGPASAGISNDFEAAVIAANSKRLGWNSSIDFGTWWGQNRLRMSTDAKRRDLGLITGRQADQLVRQGQDAGKRIFEQIVNLRNAQQDVREREGGFQLSRDNAPLTAEQERNRQNLRGGQTPGVLASPLGGNVAHDQVAPGFDDDEGFDGPVGNPQPVVGGPLTMEAILKDFDQFRNRADAEEALLELLGPGSENQIRLILDSIVSGEDFNAGDQLSGITSDTTGPPPGDLSSGAGFSDVFGGPAALDANFTNFLNDQFGRGGGIGRGFAERQQGNLQNRFFLGNITDAAAGSGFQQGGSFKDFLSRVQGGGEGLLNPNQARNTFESLGNIVNTGGANLTGAGLGSFNQLFNTGGTPLQQFDAQRGVAQNLFGRTVPFEFRSGLQSAFGRELDTIFAGIDPNNPNTNIFKQISSDPRFRSFLNR